MYRNLCQRFLNRFQFNLYTNDDYSMKRTLQIFIILAASLTFLSSCNLKSRLKKADRQFEMGQYHAASESYRRLFPAIPGTNKELRAKVAFRQGESFRMLNYSNAEQMYSNAIRNGMTDSLVYVRYAQVLQRNGKYVDAERNFKLATESGALQSQIAANNLQLVAFVDSVRKHPTLHAVRRENAFNARRSQSFSPAFLSKEGDMLFFTSNRAPVSKNRPKNSKVSGSNLNNIYNVRKNAAGKWEKPTMLESTVNTAITDDGVCSFSSDGRSMYFTRARQENVGMSGTEIFVSNRAGGDWSEPQRITFFSDSTLSVGHPAIALDGETIYFVSDAPKGMGGKDIWRGKIEGSACKYIENLGSQINTDGDEMFPVVAPDGNLYFSSTGHKGLGGLDIYKAETLKDGSFKLQHMGTPLNSNADDFGITFEASMMKGFFSSTRGENRGNDNIWSFEIPVFEYFVEGKVLDEQQNPIADAVVRLVGNQGENVRVNTRKDGTYRIKIDKDIEAVMLATARGHLNRKADINSVGFKESKTINSNFVLSTLFRPIQIENIFYEFGKWDLTPASEAGLQELVKMLNDNPNIAIEISAHTDYVGNNAANKELSARRAASVVDYLVKTGIAKARLTSVGHGEEMPFVVDTRTAQKHSFLKEADVLNESYIMALPAPEQEIANQINRRTEFRVLRTNYR